MELKPSFAEPRAWLAQLTAGNYQAAAMMVQDAERQMQTQWGWQSGQGEGANESLYGSAYMTGGDGTVYVDGGDGTVYVTEGDPTAYANGRVDTATYANGRTDTTALANGRADTTALAEGQTAN